jgi:hypothetical protein
VREKYVRRQVDVLGVCFFKGIFFIFFLFRIIGF